MPRGSTRPGILRAVWSPTETPGTEERPQRVRALRIAPELAVLITALAALIFAAAACRHTSAPSIDTVEITEPGGGDAAWCGALRPGMHVILRGHVEAAGSDTSDSFAFVATSACTLSCRVRPSLPGADLDLRAIDASNGRRIEVGDGASAERSATVRIERAGTAIDLVVSAAWGSSSYTLDVTGVQLGSGSVGSGTGGSGTGGSGTGGSGPGQEPAGPARVPSALAPLADRGFPVETGLP